ncbi:hypothetical protein [Winogradskyella sp. 3972H.M.0a.05]|uniref:hypothetical protein n=1 Tax=Winogradskyella sp. 3972H.M.0a.05 TaxID=2950277 RepID=UPI00339B56BB
MKKLVSIYLLCFSFGLMAQDYTCLPSSDEVKQLVEGFWKVEGSTSGMFYKISFSNTSGKIETLESMDFNPNRNSNKYDLVFNEDYRIVLEQEGECFVPYLEISALYGSVLEELRFDSKDQFTMNGRLYTRYNIND